MTASTTVATSPTTVATTVPTTAAATSSAANGSYLGADVDGLDKLSHEFAQAAQVVDEVKALCQAIVVAASMFGPFGAAFVAYLQGTVIPWLTRISAALKAMAQLLARHSRAQRDASSTATSLPSYVPPRTAQVAEQAPERVAPHTAEVSTNLGTIMNRDALGEFESNELGLPKGASVHPTATIAQADADIAAYQHTGEHVAVEILQLKGGAAAFAGIDPNDGGQLGVAATASADVADVTLHTDVPLGAGSTLKLADETSLGATAQGQAVAAYNSVTHTASATIGGEAFAGLRTTATVQEVTPYFTNTTEITGQLGAGAAADASVTVGAGHLTIHGGLGAAVGLGGKVSDNLDIDYRRIADDAYTGASEMYDAAGAGLDDVTRAVGAYFTPATPR